MAEQNPTEERRRVVRQRTYLQGRVYYNNRRSSMDCTIRELTKYGARLVCGELATLPDAFEVYVPSKDQYFQAHLIWRKGNEVGVEWAAQSIPGESVESFRAASDSIGDRVSKLEHEVALLRKRLNSRDG